MIQRCIEDDEPGCDSSILRMPALPRPARILSQVGHNKLSCDKRVERRDRNTNPCESRVVSM
jgi:hypothetical protein